jgi:hypothetical protein
VIRTIRLGVGQITSLAVLNPISLGNPVEDERDSGLKPNTIPL